MDADESEYQARASSRILKFCAALKTLPEVPPVEVMHLLSMAAQWPDDWNTGKQMQREHGGDAVPWKTEYEAGAGVWKRIRDGLILLQQQPK